MRRNRRNSLFISLEEETQCLPEETKELTPLEDEAVTVAIAKDEQAIEEISQALDESTNEVGNLTEQAAANSEVTEPTVNDVVQSEVALERACYILGYPRDTKISLSTESAKTQLQVSTEGIKDFIKKIITVIKNLINKAAMFFKKLIVKLKLKIGRYASKLTNLEEALKNIPNEVTDESAKAISEGLQGLNLASVKINLAKDVKKVGMPYPVSGEEAVTNIILDDPVKTFNRIVGSQATEEPKEVVAKVNNSIFQKIKNFFAKAKGSAAAKNSPVFKPNIVLLGCSGVNTYTILEQDSVDPKEALDVIGFASENVVESGLEVELNGNQVVDLLKESAGLISTYRQQLKKTDAYFKRISDLQTKVSDSIAKIEKDFNSMDIEEDSEKSIAVKNLLQSMKKVSVDYSSIVTKVFVSEIREFLVINEVFTTNLNLNA